jgi:Family of unknown function (DUF5946)
MSSGCECGAAAECVSVWHEALAAERGDPRMAVWHNPLVCAFTLQHSSHFRRRFADGQFRFLELFTDQGIQAVNAVARRTAARNRGPNPDLAQPVLDAYPPLPVTGFPSLFGLAVHHLQEPDGRFVASGYEAYGDRMRQLARATVDAWLAPNGPIHSGMTNWL